MSTNEDRELRGFMQGMVRAEAAEVTPAGDAPDGAADQRLAEAMVAKYGPRRLARRRGWVGVTTGLGAAAVLGIILVAKLRGDDPQEPLDYSITSRTDDPVMGSNPDTSAPQKLSRDGKLAIQLRPGHAVRDNPRVEAFIQVKDVLQPWPLVPEFSQGMGNLNLPVKQLPMLPRGPFELIFVLSRRALPARENLQRQLVGSAPLSCGGCQVLRRSYVGP